MKRLHLASLVALVVALCLAGSASAELRTSGRMTLDYSLQRTPTGSNWTRTIGTRLNLTAEFIPGDRDNARLVVQTSGSSANSSNSDALSVVPTSLNVDSSFVEVTTALWAGGPQWLVRIGDQSVSWSPLIVRPDDRTGITISNVNLRGVNTRWISLWGGPGDDHVTVAVTGQARIGGAVASGTYVTHGPHSQLVLEGNGFATGGAVELQGGVSLDGSHVNGAWAALGWNPAADWTLKGRFDARQNYDPLRQEYDPTDAAMAKQTTKSMFSVWTQQFGTQFDASVEFQDGAYSRTTFGAQRPVHILNRLFRSSYRLTLQEDRAMHALTSQTSFDLGVFRNVGVALKWSGGPGTPASWGAQMNYTVPSGPTLNVQYDQSGPNERTVLRMGVSLAF